MPARIAAPEMSDFGIQSVDPATGNRELRALDRTAPAIDPGHPGQYFTARRADGRMLGAAHLDAGGQLERMAILPGWQERHVDAALLLAVIDAARQSGHGLLRAHATTAMQGLLARHGFVPESGDEAASGTTAGIWVRSLQGGTAIASRSAAITAMGALIARTRRQLCIHSHALDPGLLDAAPVLDALRTLGTRGGGIRIRILLHDAATPQRTGAPLLPLAQRLPSVFAFRQVHDPVDLANPSASLFNDAGGSYFRPSQERFDGEYDLESPGRARRLRGSFDPAWERAGPCTALRALAL